MGAINKFHEGLLARKKEGFKDIKEESTYLFGQMKSFSLESDHGIEWTRLEAEIEYLEKDFDAEQVKDLFS